MKKTFIVFGRGRGRRRRLAVLAVAFVAGCTTASADVLGPAKVVDGDTIKVNGELVRLHGIDAPESRQSCERTDGAWWRCGEAATQALRQQVAGQRVTCKSEKRTRRRNRRLCNLCAVCNLPDGTDLNGWLVRNGHAVAYPCHSKRYVPQEEAAKAQGLGVWQVWTPASADVFGPADVVDGDTIKVNYERVRLHGIDTPESRQSCERADVTRWRCGKAATQALRRMVADQRVTCRDDGRGRGLCGRLRAFCYLPDGTDLSGWLVRSGHGVAYWRHSKRYVPQEEAAKAEGIGIWQGRFVEPHRWRRGDRLREETPRTTNP